MKKEPIACGNGCISPEVVCIGLTKKENGNYLKTYKCNSCGKEWNEEPMFGEWDR